MMNGELLSLKWNNHHTSFFEALFKLRQKELCIDATLACGGKFFGVHQLVLSACSDYFQEVFQKTSCKAPVVILKDIRHQELEMLLDYMYLGNVEVKQTELADLIKAAECLQVKGLVVLNNGSPGSSMKRSLCSESSPVKRPKLDDNLVKNSEKSFVDGCSLKPIEINNYFEESSTTVESIKLEADSFKVDCSEYNERLGNDYLNSESYQQEFPAGPSGMQQESIEEHNGKTTQGIECTVCSKWLEHKSSLKEHLTTHTGEKNYPCPHCSYKANHRKTLKNHLMTHTGEKPFSCPQCPYKAARKYHLQNHLMTHSSDKSFACPNCTYKTNQKSRLRNHWLSHVVEISKDSKEGDSNDEAV